MAILKSRLFLKIMVSYVVLLVTVLAATYLYMAYRIHDNYIRLESQRLSTAAKVLAKVLPVDPSMAALQSWVEEFGRQTGFRITVIAADGKVLADNQGNPATMDNHAGRPEVRDAQRMGTGVSIRFSHTVEKNELYLAHRLESPANQGLVLRLALPLQEISQGFQSTQQGLLLIWVFLFLLALTLGYLFTRSLTDRIESIRKFSEKVAHGNLDARVKEVNSDELGNLAQSLNATADELQGTIDALRSEKNRVAAILEGMRAGVLVIDREGRITLMNPVLGRILQADLNESLGKKVIAVVRNAELKGILDRVLAEKKEATATVEMALGTRRSFEVVAVPLGEAGPTSGGVVAVLHDITRLKELENIRKDFVANVSHELRTPLTSIRGFAETLLDGALDDRNNNRRFVEIIRSHAVRLSDLTMDLLTLATLEAESFQLKLETIDLPTLVQEVFESFRPLGLAKRQELEATIQSGLPPIKVDRGRIRQVLTNLLDNAVKFTPEQGTISVEVRLNPDRSGVELHVKDRGIGIPSSDLPRIFERFYRVDKARSREQGGTGLGLAIVKHIVEAHRGQVSVKSTLGQGSDFCVTLPL
jgi:two-component system, OmpR family, phosphate regulon sensor histidine kinase PhoR